LLPPSCADLSLSLSFITPFFLDISYLHNIIYLMFAKVCSFHQNTWCSISTFLTFCSLVVEAQLT
jgi:hypothetical protein